MKNIGSLFSFSLIIASSALADSTRTVYGITSSNSLIRFQSNDPATLETVPLIGAASNAIVGLDFRPQNGQLYAVGKNGSTTQIYSVHTNSGVLTSVGSERRCC